MDIRDAPLLCEREEKIRCVLDFIEDTSDRCPILLILIGSGGDGKSMATNEAIEQFHHLHEPGIAADDQRLGFRFLDSPPFRNNVRADGLFDVCTTISHGKMFKMIVHVNLWPEQMNWMLNAFRAKVVQFRYYGDMPPLAD